jgi:hypothetical protein
MTNHAGLTVRQAALIAGLGYLLSPVGSTSFWRRSTVRFRCSRHCFRLVYAGIAIVGTFNLVIVYRLLTTPVYAQLFGAGPLAAQVALFLHSFRYEYSMGLTIFALHLILIGALIYRSRYIPRWLGVILIIDGLGWIVTPLQPYLWPNTNLGWVVITALGEVIFMLWLLIWGWRIKEATISD